MSLNQLTSTPLNLTGLWSRRVIFSLCLTLTSTFTVAAEFVNKTTADGLGDNSVYDVYVIGTTIYVATGNGLSISYDGGTTFTNTSLGGSLVTSVYADGATVYAGTDGSGLYIFTDNGATFLVNKTTSDGLGSDYIQGLSVSGSTIYLATQSGLTLSTPDGAIFTNKTTVNGLVSDYVYDVWVLGADVYAATDSGLSLSTDGGTTFTVTKTFADGLGDNMIYGLYVSGTTIYAATNPATYIGGLSIAPIPVVVGSTFTNKTTGNGLADNVVRNVYVNGSTIYAATNSGLSISTDGGTSFTNKTTGDGLGNNWVNAVYVNGLIIYAATNGGLSFTVPPAAPTGLAATAVSTSQINLSWTDASDNETGFKIEQPAGAVINTTAVNAQSYSHTGLTCGTTYNYTVKATNTYGDSAGVSVSGTTAACPPPPPPVTPTPLLPEPVITPPPLPPMTLTLSFSGAGTGSLTSKSLGIDCSPTSSVCSHTVTTPTWVTLTATPGEGSQLSGWSGDPACQSDGKVFILADTACVATFELQSYELSVGRFGQGKVTGPGFDCPPDCTETFIYGTEVQLKAEADREWIHTGWKGRGDPTGKVRITNAHLCQAVFEPDLGGPNLGDGNGDGVADALQPNVISLPDKVSGSYVTFAVQPDTCAISDVYTDLPENYGQPVKNKPMPQGLIYFDLACPQAQVSLYYHAVKTVKRNFIFRKYGPLVPGNEQTVSWYLLPNVTFEAVMIDGKSVVKATYTLTDGQLGDSTGVDGRIVDPGGMMFQ